MRSKHPKHVFLGYLDIYSLQNKFESVNELIKDTFDIFLLSESKFDSIFIDSQFSIPGYCIRDHSLSMYAKFSEKYLRNIDIESTSIRLVVSVGKGRWKINENTWKIHCNILHWPINFYYLIMSFFMNRKNICFLPFWQKLQAF